MPSLFIDVQARFAQVTDALERVSQTATKSAGQMDRAFGAVKTTLAGLVAGLSVGAMKAFVQTSIDAADNLNDLSKKTGVAVETLGGLGFAAKQSGGDLETMSDGLGKLNKSVAEAAAGDAGKGAAFKALGINVRDAAGNIKAADVVLAEVADKFEGYEDGANKVAIATELFSKAGIGMIPTLNEGGAKLRENVEYFQRYSAVTQEVADKADQFNDTVAKMGLLTSALGSKIAAELLPVMQKLADRLLEAKENSTAFEKTAAVLKGALAGLLAVGSGVAFVFESIGSRIGALMAIQERLVKLDVRGALGIWRENSADIDAARTSMEKYVQSLFKVQNVSPWDSDDAAAGGFRMPRRKPDAPGLPGGKAAEAAAKKMMSLDELLAKNAEARAKMQEGIEAELSKSAEEAEAARAKLDEEYLERAEELRERLLQLVDPLRQVREEHAKIDVMVATGWLSEMEGRLAKLPNAVRDLLQPITNIHEEIQKAYEAGLLTDEEMQRASKRAMGDMDQLTEKSEGFGQAISTAFEDAVVQGKRFGDVIKSLGHTIAQIFLRQGVTKPLEKAISGFDFGSILKGIFGGGSSAGGSLGYGTIGSTPTGIMGPYATGTDFVPRTGLAFVHQGERIIPAHQNTGGGGMQFTQVNHIDSRSDAAQVRHHMAVAEQRAVRQMEDLNRRRVR